MKLRTLALVSVAALASTVGCGEAKTPTAAGANLAEPIARAFHEEATGAGVEAAHLYLKALEKAVAAADDPTQVDAIVAALDALVFRSVSAFDDVTYDSSLAFREPDAEVEQRLQLLLKKCEGPFAKGLIYEALERLARRRGDVSHASVFHSGRGCVAESLVFGPVAPSGIESVAEKSELEVATTGTALATSIPTKLAFAPTVSGLKTTSRGCSIPLYSSSAAQGVRDVVVDVDIPSRQTIGLSFSASSESRVALSGVSVLSRPHMLGSGEVTRFARVEVDKGTLRIVARVGMDSEGETIQVSVWNERGEPLKTRAPIVGTRPTSRAIVPPTPAMQVKRATKTSERLLQALAWLARGEDRLAEDALYTDFTAEKVQPELLLAYARAVASAKDLSRPQVGERKRSAYDRILTAWPNAWEAVVGHAVAAGERRAAAESRLETLKDLNELRGRIKEPLPSTVDLLEATVAASEGLPDIARASFAKAEKSGPKSALLSDVGRLAINRSGVEYRDYVCGEAQNRNAVHCHDALFMQGNWAAAEKETDRLRALRSSPDDFLARSAMSAIEQGDLPRAQTFVDRMMPGERSLWLLGAKPLVDKNAVLEFAHIAPDAPWALAPLLRVSGDNPAAPFAGLAEAITALDRKSPILPSAATAVLLHKESYELESTGLLHYVLFDVRRVSGTTDVDQHAQAEAPDLLGRDSVRVVRRRIFKKDGRILSPDRAPNASQGHADLSQLEAGDSVEAIYEGWALPTAAGTIGFDTPDALPQRTGVHDFELKVTLPKDVVGSLHTHPLLGTAASSVTGDKRTFVHKLSDAPVRRVEEGTPKMDAAVSVSFSTAKWNDFARGLRDVKSAMNDNAPEVTAWAKDAVAGKVSQREIVEALVKAAGDSVKESSTGELIDVESGIPTQTARTSLASHEGSRTWLIARALREFGIANEIVVAESDPFSADPNFPPHFGRFLHPLLIAHAKGAKGTAEDIWIDADVSGPPLPPGRISPELRGRSAIHEDGLIQKLPAFDSSSETDEIDLRVTVDAKGDAKGLVTVLLRGRAAQSLSGALERIVGQERQRVLRGVALAWVPFANVDSVQLSSSEGSWQVAIRAELSIPGFAQIEGTKVRSWVVQGVDPLHTVFPRAYVATLGATYASKKGRESALAVNDASQYHFRRRIELPKGASIAKVAGPIDVDSPLLRASRKISVNGQSIEEDFSLALSTGTVSKETYGAFTDAAHRIDDAFLASMRITPPAIP